MNKLPKTAVVPINTIQYDLAKAHPNIVSQLAASISAPWGKLVNPVLVSKLDPPENGTEWLLRKGVDRVVAAKALGLENVTVTILEGTEEQIRLLVLESQRIGRHMNAFQRMQNEVEWLNMLQKVHSEYTAGGDKAKKNEAKKEKGLSNLDDLIKQHTGLKSSAFYNKASIYKHLEPTAYKNLLEKNPDCLLANKQKWLSELKDFDEAQLNKMAAYAMKIPQPTQAYFQLQRDEAAAKADNLQQDVLFPIYHEPFWENAKRIEDGSVMLIATDPNWQLAEQVEDGEFWKEHGIPIAPKLTPSTWHQFAENAAHKLHLEGHLAVLVGQHNQHETEGILRQHLRFRGRMCYLHASGAGTPDRKAGFASHYRVLLIFQRLDAPEVCGKYKQFIHDVVPDIPKSEYTIEDALHWLKGQRKELDLRIAELEKTGEDPFTDDLIVSLVRKGELMKMWHPWAQDVRAWREVIRRFTKAGDFVWEPFVGSGTTALAAITCMDRALGSDGKWHYMKQPRVGMGCDFMEIWAKVAKYRVWEAQQKQDEAKADKEEEPEVA